MSDGVNEKGRIEMVALDARVEAGARAAVRTVREASAVAGDGGALETAANVLWSFVHRMSVVWRRAFQAVSWKITPPHVDDQWLIRFTAPSGNQTTVVVELSRAHARQFLADLATAFGRDDRLASLKKAHGKLVDHKVLAFCDCTVAREYRQLFEEHHGHPGIHKTEKEAGRAVAAG